MICRKQNRTVSLTIALVFSFSIILPAASAKVYPECRKTLCLLTLDVCHGMGSGIVSNFDMPFMSECQAGHAFLLKTGFYNALNPALNSFLAAFQLERPPRA